MLYVITLPDIILCGWLLLPNLVSLAATVSTKPGKHIGLSMGLIHLAGYSSMQHSIICLGGDKVLLCAGKASLLTIWQLCLNLGPADLLQFAPAGSIQQHHSQRG